jgi:hypothetical protein
VEEVRRGGSVIWLSCTGNVGAVLFQLDGFKEMKIFRGGAREEFVGGKGGLVGCRKGEVGWRIISEDARTRGVLWVRVGVGGWVGGWVWDRGVCLGCEVRGWFGRYDDM